MKNILALVGGGVVLCVVLACVVAALGGQGAPASTASGGSSAAPEAAAAAPVTYGLNETVAIGKTAWLVSEVRLAESLRNSSFSATPSGQFLVVTATVANNGDEPASLLAPKVVDAQGRAFETTSDGAAIMANDANCTLERLNPGTSKRCTFVYDVPTGANSWTLRANELGLFGKTVDIVLGP